MNTRNKILLQIAAILTVFCCTTFIIMTLLNTPDKFESHLNTGLKYLHNGRYKRAIKCFNNALDEEPSNTIVYMHLAEAYQYINDYESAEKSFLLMISKNVSLSEPYLKLIDFYNKTGRSDNEIITTINEAYANTGNQVFNKLLLKYSKSTAVISPTNESIVDEPEDTEVPTKNQEIQISNNDKFAKTNTYKTINSDNVSIAVTNEDDKILIDLSSQNGNKIYYTTDGTTPSIKSKLFIDTITMPSIDFIIRGISVSGNIHIESKFEYVYNKTYKHKDVQRVWDRTFGQNNITSAKKIIATNDGGYLILGSIHNTNSDILLMKISNAGEQEWTRQYDSYDEEYPIDIVEINHNEYIILAQKERKQSSWLFKIDSLGDIKWRKTFANKPTGMELTKNRKINIIQYEYLDNNVDKQFIIRTVDYEGTEYNSIKQIRPNDTDNNIFGTICYTRPDYKKNYVYSYDSNGKLLWNREYNNQIVPYNNNQYKTDIWKKIVEQDNGDFLVICQTVTVDKDYNNQKPLYIKLVSLDKYGELVSSKVILENKYSQFIDVIKTSDNKIFITGYLIDSHSSAVTQECLLYELDNDLNVLYQNDFKHTDKNIIEYNGMIEDDDSYVFLGTEYTPYNTEKERYPNHSTIRAVKIKK